MVSNPTNMDPNEFISYLEKQGITDYKQKGDEISFTCPFGSCDDDHRKNEEFHCSFNCSNCTYNCFKCGATGNYITLLKHFGDYEDYCESQKAERPSRLKKGEISLETKIRNAHKNISSQVRSYLNQRGINDDSIDTFMLGSWESNNQQSLIIPIFDKNGDIAYIKLRRPPEDESIEALVKVMGAKTPLPKYRVYPTGSKLVLVGEDQLAKSSSSDVLICEGELDRIIAIQEGIKMPVVTGGGAQTFKNEWIDSLKDMRNIFICMDRDKSGENAAEKLAQQIAERIPTASIFNISLPFEAESHGDLTDYFTQKKGTAEELFSKYSEFCCGVKPIDVSQFKEVTVEDIAKILDLTIKHDNINKVITFLVMLLAYTESEQQNVMFNADSSTGKTYICNEVSKYFPPQDVKTYGKTTPTAFYYSKSLQEKDKETSHSFINLERKILIFTEQPDTKLQENLRAVLSHDSKRTPFAITNKGKGGGNVAIEGYILGFPSTFFCSANMHVDEQEQTRCLILSPESTQEKIKASLDTSIAKNSNRNSYNTMIENSDARRQLMDRITYIKSLSVNTIDINDSDYLKTKFMENCKSLRPKTQREISHFMSLVKAMALVNAPFRMTNNKIVATKKDIDEAAKLWAPLARSMSYGVSPQALDFYKNYILSAYHNKNATGTSQPKGITYDELGKEYYNQTGSYPNMENVRKQYIPALKTAGLISYEKNEDDKRQCIITPLVSSENNLSDV